MAGHAAKSSSNPWSKLSLFTQRMIEQVAVAFGGAFFAILIATGGSLTKAVFTAAAAAGLRAAYGVVVKGFGPDPLSPSIK